LLVLVATTGEERLHEEGEVAIVTVARLVLTTTLLASVAIAIGAGQPYNLAIQSRSHFAVVEMEFRNGVNYLTSKCPLLAVARSRNGTHTFDIAVEGRFSDRAFSVPPNRAFYDTLRQFMTPPHLESLVRTSKTTPHKAE
jgi:hypothetical protein